MIHAGTQTSILAAQANRPNSREQRRAILTALRSAGSRGMTREEIEDATGLCGNQVRPRLAEMRLLVQPTGLFRNNRSGRCAEVLVAVGLP